MNESAKKLEGKKLVVLIATRERNEALDICVRELVEKAGYEDLLVAVMFDGDPLNFYRWDDKNPAYGGKAEKVLFPSRREFAKTVNDLYVRYRDRGGYFLLWNDDMRPGCDGWAAKLVKEYGERFPAGGGILAPVEPYFGEKLMTVQMFDRKFVGWLGYIGGGPFYPGYIHYGVDNELTDIAKATGKGAFSKEVTVIHPEPGVKQVNTAIQSTDRVLLESRRKGEYEGRMSWAAAKELKAQEGGKDGGKGKTSEKGK